MDPSDDRSSLEKYTPSLFGLVFGLVGFVVAEFILHEVWPTFVGIFAGMALGTLVSLSLMRRRRATSAAPGKEQDR